jgi:hypothetical protein
MEKQKGHPIGNCPSLGWLKDRWPTFSAITEKGGGKTITADLNHQSKYRDKILGCGYIICPANGIGVIRNLQFTSLKIVASRPVVVKACAGGGADCGMKFSSAPGKLWLARFNHASIQSQETFLMDWQSCFKNGDYL